MITRSSAERLGLKVGDVRVRRHQIHRSHDRERHRRRMNGLVALRAGACSGCPRRQVRPRRPAPGRRSPSTPPPPSPTRSGSWAEASRRSHPGLTVRFNFAGSQQLALQIEQGAPADVFASADQRWMSYATEKGLVDGRRQVFARNRLVAIVPRTNPARIGSLQDLARRGIKLVLAAEAVPAGKYSREALQNLAGAPGFPPEYDRRVLANVVSQEENVKAVVAKVQLGEADAGLVYRSDVTPAVAALRPCLRDPRPLQRDRDATRSRCSRPRGTPRRRGSSWSSCRATRGSASSSGTACCPPRPRHRPPPSPDRFTRRRAAGLVSRGLALRAVAVVLGALLVLLLGLPLLSLVLRIPPGGLVARLQDPLILQALRLSLVTSLASTVDRRRSRTSRRPPARHRGASAASGCSRRFIDLPMVLPPTVAGVALLTAFGRTGLAGQALSAARDHAALHHARRRRRAGVRRGAVLRRRGAGRASPRWTGSIWMRRRRCAPGRATPSCGCWSRWPRRRCSPARR